MTILLKSIDWTDAADMVERSRSPVAWCWAAVRDFQDAWELAVLTIRAGTVVSTQTLIYDRLLIRTEHLSAKAAARRMRNGNTGPAGRELPDGMVISVQPSATPTWNTTEPFQHKQWIVIDWPGWYVNFSTAGGGQVQSFNELWLPADSRRAPYFPTGFAAVASRVYGTPPFWIGTQQQRHVVIWLPDLRIRLGEVRFAKGRVLVDYETGRSPDRRVRAKAAWRLRASDATFEQAEIWPIEDSGELAVQTGWLPAEFRVQVSDNGRLLDRRGWSDTEGRPPRDESTLDAQVSLWLLEGEGLQLEYKEKIGKDSNREFAESVAAFANGDGGVILLGVSDSAEVVGVDVAKVEDVVTSIVRSSVQDYIEVKTTNVIRDGRPIYVVQVPKGPQPPYQSGGKVVVRAGATDRVATPAELRALSTPQGDSFARSPFSL